jgi:hypothetical protein
MCRIENNYIPPGPEQYEKLAAHIKSRVLLEYHDEENSRQTRKGILRSIEVINYAEHLNIDGLSVRLDKVISMQST